MPVFKLNFNTISKLFMDCTKIQVDTAKSLTWQVLSPTTTQEGKRMLPLQPTEGTQQQIAERNGVHSVASSPLAQLHHYLHPVIPNHHVSFGAGAFAPPL